MITNLNSSARRPATSDHVTLTAVAKKSGYSKNTVSLALRDNPQIPLRTRNTIRETARKMGYQRNSVLAHLMALLRARDMSGRFQGKLALVNGNLHCASLKSHPALSSLVAGCNERAQELGYSFDHFWLHDPELTADRWMRILKARGIRGIVIVGLQHANHLPESLLPLWQQFATVVTGVRTTAPALPFCSVDHFELALNAFDKVLSLGYRRPGLAVDQQADRLVDLRYSASIAACQSRLPGSDRVPAFMEAGRGELGRESFYRWYDEYKPDVILTLYQSVIDWLDERCIRLPGDQGLVSLEWRPALTQVAGMNQHNDLVGRAAVDNVVSQIHHNQSGVHDFPLSTLITATWTDGHSVKDCRRLTAESEVGAARVMVAT